ncbi:hypothetical protein PF005_g29700 [Phytophthora fragariae]|uniref:PH domain-containing protein n=2 Tax=Phytophthora fragariae TaxID=53985 RepID=A0A6A3DMM8_9STRA|nr:hypothetical protein PF009_g30057 [Phytophthora fragariae]KAE9062781.1 hypothetical protein PF010_g29264 [Phytophthora fragariae]KAE9063548.1 hypothetical protein PF007_g29511 [Phytophthora fragariae]KAE9070206.1 hypothetical protein PF006_g29403 [Phytophthora fragariae]KAE9165220.1 hypothetical protein PF005_g29700 [Phytophthora fragariae]
MACGKFHVQWCSLIWFLSTIYLVPTALPKLPVVKGTTEAVFTLVVKRSRVAGGTLTIPLDSTIKIVKSSSRDVERNVIRLEHGSTCKRLVMRASSPQEREKWLNAIRTAVSATQQCMQHVPAPTTTCSSASTPKRPCTKDSQPSQPRQAQPTTQHAAHVAPFSSSCSLRRMLGRNVPNVMQFVTTVGHIVAAAT